MNYQAPANLIPGIALALDVIHAFLVSAGVAEGFPFPPRVALTAVKCCVPWAIIGVPYVSTWRTGEQDGAKKGGEA
jgi:hypothetical protein